MSESREVYIQEGIIRYNGVGRCLSIGMYHMQGLIQDITLKGVLTGGGGYQLSISC